jgi:hypothetical protein
MSSLNTALEPLDLIKRQIDSRADHYGIYLGEVKGLNIVFDLTHVEETGKACCRIITFEEFANGKPVQKIACERSNAEQIKQRMVSLMQDAQGGEVLYSVAGSSGWNCEEAARYVLTGERTSIQLKAEQKTHGLQKASVGAGFVAIAATVLAAGAAFLADKQYKDEKARLEKDKIS